MSSSSGLTFKLHPLVIVNISDHHTRIKAQTPGAARPPRVYGCVLGVQTGRTVEIFNSFELRYDPVAYVLDRAFLETKQEQCEFSPCCRIAFLTIASGVFDSVFGLL
jgi:COP9 signalosome complex subunit 6